ncbi:MAG: hypothetical protein K6T73_06170 [Candidatus Bathyarchaeota archaeon]|nr:hypothetical protein [Candidatus Bathyarchaeota archaeon]
MTEKEAKAVTCPFCGAPYRKFIPSNALQLKCTYCGGIFLVPQEISGGLPKCFNHDDRLAIGLCNDCGENFCSECLYIYDLQTRDTEATLYLCLECLTKRHRKEADSFIYAKISEWVAEIGAEATYALFVELGTRYMQAQPYLYPAIQEHLPQLEAIICEAIDQAKAEAGLE